MAKSFDFRFNAEPETSLFNEVPVGNNSEQRIVPGISVSPTGQATVDSSVSDVLFDLALRLEEPTGFPVDVEHVLAAVVLAARHGEIDRETPLSGDSSELVNLLVKHVKTVFEKHNGIVGRDP